MPTPPAVHRGAALSGQEIQTLRWAAHGLTNERIALHMGLKVDTTKTHLRRAFVKLGASDRAHAVTLAFAAGYLVLDPSGRVAMCLQKPGGCTGMTHARDCRTHASRVARSAL